MFEIPYFPGPSFKQAMFGACLRPRMGGSGKISLIVGSSSSIVAII